MKKLAALLCLSILALVPLRAEGFQEWIRRMEARKIQISAGIWDLESGKTLDSYQSDLGLVPASTTKVVSSYALLKSLKPEFTVETEIWGTVVGDTVTGDLYLKGAGDPYLTLERLWSMGQTLKAKGIARVQGSIRLDQSAYDDQRYASGWENTSIDTTPPILPLLVNFARDERGKIAHDPEPLAVAILTRIFGECGIQILGQPVLKEGELARILAFPSYPLRILAQDINKHSNNFMVEMLVKKFGDGSWPKGVQRIQEFYRTTLQLGPDQIRITDGSGLSKENRLSAKTLATILRAAWYDYEVGPEFVASLKIIGGEPWELLVKDANLARRIRCKTGHLSQVTSVCGYLQAPDGKLKVFAILLNGHSRNDDVWSLVSSWAN